MLEAETDEDVSEALWISEAEDELMSEADEELTSEADEEWTSDTEALLDEA